VADAATAATCEDAVSLGRRKRARKGAAVRFVDRLDGTVSL
jgi:hypothetical protein